MTLEPQGIEWEISQVGITAGKPSLLLSLSRGGTRRGENTPSHTRENRAMLIPPLDLQGHGENDRLGRRLSKRWRRRHPRNSSKGRRFIVLLGL